MKSDLDKIFVTEPNKPNQAQLESYLKSVVERGYYTNNGPLVKDLEARLKELLSVRNFLLLGNGTLALQLLFKAFQLKGEVITTPYSYVATSNALVWENLKPVFVDIESDSFGLDPAKIEERITPQTSAILGTHVYGMPNKVEELSAIAEKHGIPLIFDAAHCFMVNYRNKPLVSFGAASTLSFHATKVFHTVEGGGICINNDELRQKLFLQRSFGHQGDNYQAIGINAKNTEVHAAFGLSQLDQLPDFIQHRKSAFETYRSELASDRLTFLAVPADLKWNYGYCPVFFESNRLRDLAFDALASHGIVSRKYFAPSLNTLDFVSEYVPCPVSEDVASRVLCLPLFAHISSAQLGRVIDALKTIL